MHLNETKPVFPLSKLRYIENQAQNENHSHI